MVFQEILDKTKTLNQGEFLQYLQQLKNIASRKYGINVFFYDFVKQKNEFFEIKERKKRKLGFLKGVEYYIAEDFDAPLDDLKDYM
ncbi:MAG: hypothetical protein B6I24_09800 [Bacteroidetes bacterium 4572_128]|nr:MAG: hypothetical protein B6I24_09800 [Bacteroidetes bacterium 4572_128]